jgi:ribosomal-protein-alanine N-acetyltransferase
MSPEVTIPIATELEGARLLLRAPRPGDATQLRSLLIRNADHLRPWSPSPAPGTNPLLGSELSRSISRQRREWKHGLSYVFLIALRMPGQPLVGRVALTSVTRGPFQNAHLGYWVDITHVGRGLATEAIDLALAFAFDRLLLHRIQAAVMPHNGASRSILAKRRFREEGYARRYLCIAGRWEDHLLYGLTKEEWRETGGTQPPARAADLGSSGSPSSGRSLQSPGVRGL